MVYNPNKGLPGVIQSSYSDAKKEAERISKKEGGQVFILRTIGCCSPAAVEWNFWGDEG